MTGLSLTQEQLDSMFEYLNEHLPNEACGLLAGKNDRVEKIFFVKNQVQSPVRFIMDPLDQLNAFKWIDSNGMELLAIFHSHPTGPEIASPTDITEAAYDVVHIICSRSNEAWKARGFVIKDGLSSEVQLNILK